MGAFQDTGGHAAFPPHVCLTILASRLRSIALPFLRQYEVSPNAPWSKGTLTFEPQSPKGQVADANVPYQPAFNEDY